MNPAQRIDQTTLPAKVLGFMPEQRDAILNGRKTHCLLPFTGEDIVQSRRRLTLEAFLNRETDVRRTFAVAEAGDVLLLRINPRNESIYQYRPGAFSTFWDKLSDNLVRLIVQREGFTHKDNFWQIMQNNVTADKVLEVFEVQLLNVIPIF